MRDPLGAVAGRIFAFRDISADRMVEQVKSDFVAAVSHELRTPLTSIYGFAETLLREDIPFGEEERRIFLGYIASESERLTEIVDQLLNVARLDAGDLQVELGRIDLGSVVSELVETVEESGVVNGHRFENEQLLIKRAKIRPWLGWGRFGRSFVYDEDGRMVTIVDSMWIIAFGFTGLVGLLAQPRDDRNACETEHEERVVGVPDDPCQFSLEQTVQYGNNAVLVHVRHSAPRKRRRCSGPCASVSRSRPACKRLFHLRAGAWQLLVWCAILFCTQ